MDDRTFDQKTAQDWICAVEKTEKSFRDDFVYPKINNLISLAKPKTILDIGCGQGIASGGIQQCKYTGVDPSPFLVERANQLYSGSHNEFLVGSVYDLPIQDQSFDFVFSILVWHLLEDIEKAALELSRVLVEDGSFLIVTANPQAYDQWVAFYPDAKLTGKKLEGTMKLSESLSRDVLYLHTYDELKSSFKKAQLSIEATDSANLLFSIQGRKKSGGLVL